MPQGADVGRPRGEKCGSELKSIWHLFISRLFLSLSSFVFRVRPYRIRVSAGFVSS